MTKSKARIKVTGEVFTPDVVVQKLLNQIPEEKFQDPNSTFLDNSAGNGNFLFALKQRLCQYHPEDHVLDNMIYAVEFMSDNHTELCERLGVPVSHPHYVCANALEYDYTFSGKSNNLSDFF